MVFIIKFPTETSTSNLKCSSFSNSTEKYEYVGRLLRPGEEPNSYSDEEDESSESAKGNKTDDITNINSTDASAPASEKPKDE